MDFKIGKDDQIKFEKSIQSNNKKVIRTAAKRLERNKRKRKKYKEIEKIERSGKKCKDIERNRKK